MTLPVAGADVKLHRASEAPMLNSYIADTESILQLLLNTLGKGTAQELTATALNDATTQPAGTGAAATDYHATDTQLAQYKSDLNSLDTRIADIAQKSAGITESTRSEVKALRDTINGIIDTVREKPSVQEQLGAIDRIDVAVGKAEQAVVQAWELNNAHGATVQQASTGGGSGGSGSPGFIPSSYGGSGGGGNSYVPTNGSGGYNDRYTSPVDPTGSGSGGPHRRLSSAELDAYIGKALDALGITDPVARANWTRGYRVLIERESGGDIGAINLSDSNARAGTPSQGLTQTIPGTFKAYHVAGTSSNITDPQANIAASMNYVMERYHVSRDGSNLAANVQQADPNRPSRGY
ncbi:transglycosylase SLT domain-containing protein [Nocardia acidivorans]|uniref:transglycosylase SLT domain-containing protein n=1 Tax=Nocardia acidivorans TaxID=404580 RepID=UPI001FE221B5|nr:transglycosylase SLT domain-containing protein [Nocardia acidivorans]